MDAKKYVFVMYVFVYSAIFVKSLEIIIIMLIERPPTFQPKHGQVGVFQVTSRAASVVGIPTFFKILYFWNQRGVLCFISKNL